MTKPAVCVLGSDRLIYPIFVQISGKVLSQRKDLPKEG